MRARIGAGLAFAIVLTSGVAAADGAPSKSACIDAYKSSQELSRAGALTRARQAALLCARDPCPAVLQKDCADWLADVEQRLPTLLLVLRDESGRDVAGARVAVDGVEVATRLDGRPIEVDPGEHKIKLTVEGRPPLEQTIIARERDKSREIAFAFAPAAKPIAPPPPPPNPGTPETAGARPLPWTFWAASVTSGVGLVGFGVFGVSGLSLRGNMDSCKPNCSQERIDRGETSFLIADIGLGVAVVAATVATVIYLTRP